MRHHELKDRPDSLSEGYEECVICHKMTDYTKDIPIGRRKNYVIGRGQLCDGCFGSFFSDSVGESAGKAAVRTVSDSDGGTVIPPFEQSGEYFVERLGEIEKKPAFDFFKRLSDIVLAILFGILLLIPMAVIGVIIKLCSKGPVFYAQERLGLNGKKFQVIKFRTMDSDAEIMGPQWSAGDDDPRIFPFGRFLRKTRLDELPQWWCVLRNDMSFVGPRPERECFAVEFERYIHGFDERLKVKPGITGHAQVNGGYDLKPEEKIVYDIEYIKNRSLWMDFKILIKTVAVVLCQKGAK